MTGLVDDMLVLARLDQGRPLEQEPVDLQAIATDAVADARAVAPQRDIRIWPDRVGEPAEVAYACAWHAPNGLFARFAHLKVIFSLGAGVDHPLLTAFPEGEYLKGLLLQIA